MLLVEEVWENNRRSVGEFRLYSVRPGSLLPEIIYIHDTLGSDPAVGVSIKKNLPTLAQVIGTRCMPKAAVKQNGSSGWHLHRHCVNWLIRIFLGKDDFISLLLTWSNVEIGHSHFSSISQKICDLQREHRVYW